jgi:hypothetical protein
MVEVEWIDSMAAHGWHEQSEVDGLMADFPCLTVGYLVREKAEGIVIALAANRTDYLSAVAIPREAIRKIHRLRR